MPREPRANPFNIGRGLRDIQGRIPHPSEVKTCPVYQKTFEKYATIELLDIEPAGEIDYYCPHCDALVMREFISPGRQAREIVDPAHVPQRK